MILRYVGIDPGVRNYAVVTLNARGIVIDARMFTDTISSMKASNAYMRPRYRKAIRKLLRYLKPTHVIAEQFAARGFGTQLTEMVNLMIGGMQMVCDYLRIQEATTLASTWKNAINKLRKETKTARGKRTTYLDSLYAYAHERGMAKHVVDAMCLGLFLRGGMAFHPDDTGNMEANLRRCVKYMKRNSPTEIRKPKRALRDAMPPRRRKSRTSVRERKVLVKRQASKRKLRSI